MKIDGAFIGQAVEKSGQSSTQAKGKTGGADDDAFGALLQSEAQPAGQTAGQDSAVYGPTSVAGLLSLQAIARGAAQPSRSSEAISSLNSVLDGLDSLHNALKTTTSPKDINSLIEGINQQAASLDDKTAGLPADSGLRDLAEETKIAAYMESLKLKRGDYS